MEEKKLLEILVVEDYTFNLDVAIKYFTEQEKLKADFAEDYESGNRLLENKRYDFLISDLLMPRQKGSDDMALGRKLFKKIESELEVKGHLDFERGIVKEDLKNLRNALFEESQEIKEIPYYPYYLTEQVKARRLIAKFNLCFGKFESKVKEVKKLLPQKAIDNKNNRELHYSTWLDRWLKNETQKLKEKYNAKRASYTLIIERKSSDQPLGILLAEKAREKEVPYMVVTSGHGGHGDLTTPIAYYMKHKGLIKSYDGDLTKDGEEKITDNPFVTDAKKDDLKTWEFISKKIRKMLDR